MSERLYFVETWDSEKQAFTPQEGVPIGPYTKFGLRKAIRDLREIGYPCWYRSFDLAGDAFVSIYAMDGETA